MLSSHAPNTIAPKAFTSERQYLALFSSLSAVVSFDTCFALTSLGSIDVIIPIVHFEVFKL